MDPGSRARPELFVPTDEVAAQVEYLSRASGPTLAAVILFGSRLLGTSPDPHSATDLFVVVDSTRSFYGRLRERGMVQRSAFTLSVLNRWLTPNVISVRPPAVEGAGAKCFVVTREGLERALSSRSADHFCKGRLSQRVEFVFVRESAVLRSLMTAVTRARVETLCWVPLDLPREFDARTYCEHMLRVSYAGEIRPERGERVREVFSAQEHQLVPLYRDLISRHGPEHGVVVAGDHFVRTRAVSRVARLRWAWYFRRSRIRATLRWSKYLFTYDDWLDYIVRKLRRRTGLELEIRPAERRWPLVLLWPKLFRVLRALRRARCESMSPGDER